MLRPVPIVASPFYLVLSPHAGRTGDRGSSHRRTNLRRKVDGSFPVFPAFCRVFNEALSQRRHWITSDEFAVQAVLCTLQVIKS